MTGFAPHSDQAGDFVSPHGFARASRFAHHGGALDAARRLYPDAPKPWIDLSTGINPWPYPVPTLDPDVWTRLPDDASLSALETEAARLYRCPPAIAIVAAPGTQAIIQLLPMVLGGPDVRILGQTYGEFARVFASAGSRVRIAATTADLAGADVAIVVNPNNPDGRLVPPDALTAMAANVGALVVDEAFMDALDPSSSVVPTQAGGRLVVLRSFGKFYGLAGLRLGFALAPPKVAARLRTALGPWAVSGPALAIGAAALGDTAWADASRKRLDRDANRLDKTLTGAGFTILGGTPLFRLARHPSAPALFETLAAAGILTRPFADQPDRLRFGLPDSSDTLSRVALAITR